MWRPLSPKNLDIALDEAFLEGADWLIEKAKDVSIEYGHTRTPVVELAMLREIYDSEKLANKERRAAREKEEQKK